MKRVLSSVLSLVLILTLFTSTTVFASAAPESVAATLPAPISSVFPNYYIAGAVARALGVNTSYSVSANDLMSITSFSCRSNYISNLTGLNYLTNLTYLDLSYNNISDISPLAGLTNLTYLDLYDNKISDFSPLADLTSLKHLDLGGNSNSDISPLAGLTNLTYLDLGCNFISNLIPLADLTNLTGLDLCPNLISDISPLAGLTNLTGLDLRDNEISDISPLAGLTNLTALYMNDSNISDISPLAGLTNLTDLDLYNANISNISPLAGLTKLTELILYNNKIADISPLAGLTKLTELLLDTNKISDISPLAGLTNLTRLFLGVNNISDISPLAAITAKGCEINVAGQRISIVTSDFSTLSSVPNIAKDANGAIKIAKEDINNNGTYNSATNTVSWGNPTHANAPYIYSFSSEVSKTCFNGTVTYIEAGLELSESVVSMQYKSTHKLSFILNRGFLATTWSSSDERVVTVDENGILHAKKGGNAIITCSVTDYNGTVLQQTCTVTVNYVWWQWLIKIMLFGWFWY